MMNYTSAGNWTSWHCAAPTDNLFLSVPNNNGEKLLIKLHFFNNKYEQSTWSRNSWEAEEREGLG